MNTKNQRFKKFEISKAGAEQTYGGFYTEGETEHTDDTRTTTIPVYPGGPTVTHTIPDTHADTCDDSGNE